MISKYFIKSSIIYSIVGSLPIASGFILLPFFANYLDSTVYGQYALLIIFSALMQTIINLGIDYMVQISYFEMLNTPGKLKKTLGTLNTGIILTGILSIAFFLLFGDWIFKIVYPSSQLQFFPFGFVSLLIAFTASFTKTYNNLLVNQQRPVRFFVLNILNFILTIGLSILLLVIYPNSVAGPLYGKLIATSAVFIIAVFSFAKEFGIFFNLQIFKNGLKISFPFLLNALIGWVLLYSDRLIITKYMSLGEMGIYDFTLKISYLIDVIIIGLWSAIGAKLYKHLIQNNITKSDETYNTYFSGLTSVIILLILFSVSGIHFILPFIKMKVEYYDALNYFGFICIIYISKSLFLMFVAPIYAFKKTTWLVKIFSIAAIIQLSMSFAFIQFWGLNGAISSLIISSFIQVALIYYHSRKIFTFIFNTRKMIVLPMIFFIVALSGEILGFHFNRIWIYSIEIILTGILIYYFYRKEIKKLIQSFGTQNSVLSDKTGELINE